MIDLHAHTTASDGSCDPAELVSRARAAGLRTIAVTDHDTMAGVAAAREAGAAAGVDVVPGIEITAVDRECDVHVLGYFLDPEEPRLAGFLAAQRRDRVRRVREMAALLSRLGYPIDEPIAAALAAAGTDRSRSVGRPLLARVLVEGGHAVDMSDAFERLIGQDCPAYVPRRGASPSEVVALIHAAGGLASLAHPGQTARDDLLPRLIEDGLDALEVRHPDHPADVEARYTALARDAGLAITGGSDYHGSPEHGAEALGLVTLSDEEFEAFSARRRQR